MHWIACSQAVHAYACMHSRVCISGAIINSCLGSKCAALIYHAMLHKQPWAGSRHHSYSYSSIGQGLKPSQHRPTSEQRSWGYKSTHQHFDEAGLTPAGHQSQDERQRRCQPEGAAVPIHQASVVSHTPMRTLHSKWRQAARHIQLQAALVSLVLQHCCHLPVVGASRAAAQQHTRHPAL